MTQFAWSKILSIWEQESFRKELIGKKTLHGIIDTPDKEGGIANAWKVYVDWLAKDFKRSENVINLLFTKNFQNGKNLNLEWKKVLESKDHTKIKEYLNDNFIADSSLLTAIREEFKKIVDEKFDPTVELPGEALEFFKKSGVSLLPQLKNVIDKETNYKVMDIAFLEVIISDYYLISLPNAWEDSWKVAEPRLKLTNFGEKASQAVSKVFNSLIVLIDDLTLGLADHNDIAQIKDRLVRRSLELADIVEEERRNELIRIQERLEARLKGIDDTLPIIMAEKVMVVKEN